MPINEQNCIKTIENKLQQQGFNLNKASQTKKLVEILVKEIITEIKKSTISVPALGLVAPPNGGPVTGEAKGTIS